MNCVRLKSAKIPSTQTLLGSPWFEESPCFEAVLIRRLYDAETAAGMACQTV